MQHDDLVYAGHMFDAATKAVETVAGIGRSDFDRDETLRLALTHLLQIIGMRHKVVHDYFGVDDDVVWDTVINELPPLIEKIRSLDTSL
jgi:uncharacterized protein with HEPN domain